MSTIQYHYLKYGDVLPAFESVLYNPDGSIYDLSGAQNVALHVKLSSGTTVKLGASATSSTGGVVGYSWTTGDWASLTVSPTAARGVDPHYIEVEVIDASGKRVTFPNDREGDVLVITEDIEDST